VELTRLAAARLGKTVLELQDVSAAADSIAAGAATAGRRVLLDDVTWQLGPGERVGVVGVNGSGKTTLLRLLSGAQPVPAGPPMETAGQVITGSTVRLGYLTQEPASVDEDLRVLEAAEQIRGSARIGTRDLPVSQLLERLGLRGERQWTRVGDLSGGERRRLQILLMLLAEPNVLLLDEPTNDLDIETLTELEDLLDGWAGSVVVVSHDRYFLERVTDHVVALLDGGLAYLPGGVDEYLSIRAGNESAPAAGRAPGRARADDGPAPDGRGGHDGSDGGPTAAQVRTGQKELARLERQIARLAGTEDQLSADLAANATDYARLVDLGEQLRAAQRERAGLEERWLELAEEISG
jgi:ATP-binding cassette subfamily F protein uup